VRIASVGTGAGPGPYKVGGENAVDDIITGLAFLLLGVIIIWQVRGLPASVAGVPFGSATFPRLLSILMMLLAAWLIIRGLRGGTSQPRRESPKVNMRSLLGMAATVVYLLALKWLGFALSTTALLISYALLIQREKPRKLDTFVMPIITVAIVYIVFHFLGVSLPQGVFSR